MESVPKAPSTLFKQLRVADPELWIAGSARIIQVHAQPAVSDTKISGTTGITYRNKWYYVPDHLRGEDLEVRLKPKADPRTGLRYPYVVKRLKRSLDGDSDESEDYEAPKKRKRGPPASDSESESEHVPFAALMEKSKHPRHPEGLVPSDYCKVVGARQQPAVADAEIPGTRGIMYRDKWWYVPTNRKKENLEVRLKSKIDIYPEFGYPCLFKRDKNSV